MSRCFFGAPLPNGWGVVASIIAVYKLLPPLRCVMNASAKSLQMPAQNWFSQVSQECGLPVLVRILLGQMQAWHPPTYEHLLRVGRLCWEIAPLTGGSAKNGCLAGLCHDVGKLWTPLELLNKPSANWSHDNAIDMQEHVMNGFLMLVPRLPFIAHIVVRHHRFQKDPYPSQLPRLPAKLLGLEKEIETYAAVLATADCYDAKWRSNAQCNKLTGAQIKEEMLICRPHHADLIKELYAVGIFTETAPF